MVTYAVWCAGELVQQQRRERATQQQRAPRRVARRAARRAPLFCTLHPCCCGPPKVASELLRLCLLRCDPVQWGSEAGHAQYTHHKRTDRLLGCVHSALESSSPQLTRPRPRPPLPAMLPPALVQLYSTRSPWVTLPSDHQLPPRSTSLLFCSAHSSKKLSAARV